MKSDNEVSSEGHSGKRLRSELRVYYGAVQEKLLSGFSVDISTGGLYLQTESLLPLDEDLRLHFTLPDQDQSLSCKARVAWVNEKENPRKPGLPPGVGVQFVDLSLDALKAIRRFLEHNEIEPTW